MDLICRTVVTVTSPDVEVPAAETSVVISAYNTHTSIVGTTITFEASVQTVTTAGSTAFVATVNGGATTLILPFTTTWTFSSTSLELSFAARTSAFIFTGDSTVEITIPAEHTHVTVGGVETAIDLSGITTTLIGHRFHQCDFDNARGYHHYGDPRGNNRIHCHY